MKLLKNAKWEKRPLSILKVILLKSKIHYNFEWPTFAYMNILNTRTGILCNRNEKIINQKFVLLKVASDKKFGQHFS
jgi:hypothetical protein